MTAPRQGSEEARRARVCHGWAFIYVHEDVRNAIRLYIETGEMTDLLPSQYREMDRIVK